MPLNQLLVRAHLNSYLSKQHTINTVQELRRRSSIHVDDILPSPATTTSFVLDTLHETTNSLKRGARMLYLFTKSDLKSLLIPCLMFAVVTTFSTETLHLPPPQIDATPAPFTRMLLRTSFWIFMLLLPFDIDNQRLATSVVQDSSNKPWRPIPAGLITRAQATDLMWTILTLSFATAMILGGAWQACGIAATTYAYNHLRCADRGALIRNAINVPGYLLFFHGASEVALGASIPFNGRVALWYALVGASCHARARRLHRAANTHEEE